MAVERMDHVGVVVDDLPASIEFFTALGLELQDEGTVRGAWVDRIVGLDGVESDLAMMRSPDGLSRLELVRFRSPPAEDGGADGPSNALGLRHLCFAVTDVEGTVKRLQTLGGELVGEIERYEDKYRLCYLRGPEGIILELAERLV